MEVRSSAPEELASPTLLMAPNDLNVLPNFIYFKTHVNLIFGYHVFTVPDECHIYLDWEWRHPYPMNTFVNFGLCIVPFILFQSSSLCPGFNIKIT
jgi:hypothetical protein